MKTQRHREKERHVKMEADLGVTHLQAKEHQGLPAIIRSERYETEFPFKSSEGANPADTSSLHDCN